MKPGIQSGHSSLPTISHHYHGAHCSNTQTRSLFLQCENGSSPMNQSQGTEHTHTQSSDGTKQTQSSLQGNQPDMYMNEEKILNDVCKQNHNFEFHCLYNIYLLTPFYCFKGLSRAVMGNYFFTSYQHGSIRGHI